MLNKRISETTITKKFTISKSNILIIECQKKKIKWLNHEKKKNLFRKERFSERQVSLQNTDVEFSNKNVRWTLNTLDNEFLNKKKSKSCCIFHKTKKWNESDTEKTN